MFYDHFFTENLFPPGATFQTFLGWTSIQQPFWCSPGRVKPHEELTEIMLPRGRCLKMGWFQISFQVAKMARGFKLRINMNQLPEARWWRNCDHPQLIDSMTMDYFPGPLASETSRTHVSSINVWSDFVFTAQNDRGPRFYRSNLCEAAVDRLRLLN